MQARVAASKRRERAAMIALADSAIRSGPR
jgi:hypothetical protein